MRLSATISSFRFLVPFAASALACVACGGSPDDLDTTSSDVTVAVLQGADSASAFSVAEAKALKSSHGVEWSGVYIGGPCDGGSGWTKSVVENIHAATNWQFMPIYVGQNSRAVCHTDNLTEAQGKVDGADAAAKMVEFGWDGNKKIPVELDLESETFSGAPSASLNYVRGWVAEVHAKGYLAYVYTSPSAVNAIADAKLAVDGVTVAAWLWNDGIGHFENNSPFDTNEIGSHFNNHNRAWQYCGDISTDGVRVDCNTSDLILAPAPGGSNGTGGGSTGGGGGGTTAAADACSKGDGFCTETLQCDKGHWIIRQDDNAACTTVDNVEEPCSEGNGYCTATLQCDGGHWVPRSNDPAACTSGPG